MSITDPEVNELVKDGKALLSTAFSAAPDENGVLRNIVPNHILVYPAEPGAPNPGDQAALFLNQKQEPLKNGDTMGDEPKNDKQLDLMRELVANQAAKDELQTKVTEQTETILNQKSELEAKDRAISEKDGVITQKNELITNQKTEIELLTLKLQNLPVLLRNQKQMLRKPEEIKYLTSSYLELRKLSKHAKKTFMMTLSLKISSLKCFSIRPM